MLKYVVKAVLTVSKLNLCTVSVGAVRYQSVKCRSSESKISEEACLQVSRLFFALRQFGAEGRTDSTASHFQVPQRKLFERKSR